MSEAGLGEGEPSWHARFEARRGCAASSSPTGGDMNSREIPLSVMWLGAMTLVLFLVTGSAWIWGVEHAVEVGAPIIILCLTATFYISYKRVSLHDDRARATVERAADGIVTTDSRGHIETMNAAAEALFGYHQAELKGYSLTALLSSSYTDSEEGDLWDFLRENAIKATGVAQEVIGLRKGGKKFFMDLSISDTQVGDELVFIAIFRDVTEKKKAQIALNKAHDRLEVRVEQRTAELRKANERLEAEIEVRVTSESQREKLVHELQDALAEIKALTGLIPICASCKNVRDDRGYWNRIEEYVGQRSDAEFSHSICPVCADKLYPGLTRKS